MTRMLLLVIAVVVFVWLLRRALTARRPPPGAGPAKNAPVPELVACARCGVHLPKTEAFALEGEAAPAAGRYFCSQDHLRLGPK